MSKSMMLNQTPFTMPVVLVMVDGRTNEILDVRVEQPQFVTALLALKRHKDGNHKDGNHGSSQEEEEDA